MTRHLLKAAALGLAAFAASGVAQAQETACGALDSAPDGLCYAYCEAVDCDGVSPGAGAETCGALFHGYKQLTGTAPPCEQALLCPCSAAGLFHDILSDPSDTTRCVINHRVLRLREAEAGIFVAHREQGNWCGTFEAGAGVSSLSSISLEEARVCWRQVRRAAFQGGHVCS